MSLEDTPGPIGGGETREPFSSWIEETSRASVVRATGELDDASTPRLQAHLEEAAGRGRHIIVDLSAVAFLDVHSLRVLEAYYQRCRDHGSVLAVVAPPHLPRQIMEILGFMNEVPVVDSMEAAMDLLPP